MSDADVDVLIGEPLALDLVNTRPEAQGGGRADLIATPEHLAAWLDSQSERLSDDLRDDLRDGAAATPADLAALHSVRAHIEAVVGALLGGAVPAPADLRALTDAQRKAPAVRELGWDGASVTAVARRAGPLGARLAAHFAESAAELLTGPGVARLKECEAHDCVLVFLPAHPRRRWCSAARCGNRVRVARYYQRHSGGAGSGQKP